MAMNFTPRRFPMATTFDSDSRMPEMPASDVKKLGWKSVALRAREHGEVVITNHNRPEAVVVDIERYEQLVAQSRAGDPLAALRRDFEARVEALHERLQSDALADAIDAGPDELAQAANRGRRDR